MRNKWLLQIQKTLHKYPGKPINQVLQIAKINYEKERKKKKKKIIIYIIKKLYTNMDFILVFPSGFVIRLLKLVNKFLSLTQFNNSLIHIHYL